MIFVNLSEKRGDNSSNLYLKYDRRPVMELYINLVEPSFWGDVPSFRSPAHRSTLYDSSYQDF